MSKGNQVNIPEPDFWEEWRRERGKQFSFSLLLFLLGLKCGGNTYRTSKNWRGPREEFSFLFNSHSVTRPSALRIEWRKSAVGFGCCSFCGWRRRLMADFFRLICTYFLRRLSVVFRIWGKGGWWFVLASPESGYLEKGNDDWQSVSFSEASGAASDSP